MKRKRTKPYTELGIRRLKCCRCGDKASTQWQVCALGNEWQPVCAFCDIELNKLVLEFMRFPDRIGALYESKKILEIVEEAKT